MNRLGVLADVSGACDAPVGRAVVLSRTPVLCTRSAARALRPHPANLLAAQGLWHGAAHRRADRPERPGRRRPSRPRADGRRGHRASACPATYDSGAAHPQDLTDASCYPHLIAELLHRGWSDIELTLLTWGNVQRVLRTADFTARAAQLRREASTAKIAELDG